jgi:hypothetical protein
MRQAAHGDEAGPDPVPGQGQDGVQADLTVRFCDEERAREILRSVVIGLLLSCIASTAFGQDASATPHPFYMLGEISHPGELPYRAGLNVVGAIAMAGGETGRASKAQVLIQHLGEPAFKVYPLSPATPVLPGDTIKLPDRPY